MHLSTPAERCPQPASTSEEDATKEALTSIKKALAAEFWRKMRCFHLPRKVTVPLATVVALFWKLFTAFSRQPVTWFSAESENPFDHHHTTIIKSIVIDIHTWANGLMFPRTVETSQVKKNSSLSLFCHKCVPLEIYICCNLT